MQISFVEMLKKSSNTKLQIALTAFPYNFHPILAWYLISPKLNKIYLKISYANLIKYAVISLLKITSEKWFFVFSKIFHLIFQDRF